jgi:hypothetical protein
MVDEGQQGLPSLLRLRVSYEDRPSGGPWLLDWLERPRLERSAAAASLEFSSDPNRPLRVAEGPLAGETWPELAARFGERLLGRCLLELKERGLSLDVRFVAAEDMDAPVRLILSPAAGDSGAPALEAVTILEARPGAAVYAGRRRSLPEDRFLSCLRSGPGPELLQEHAAEPGSSLLFPPGLPYVLGRGVLAHAVTLRRTERGEAEGRACAGIKGPAAAVLRAPLLYSRLAAKSRGWLDGLNAVTWLYAAGPLCTIRLDLRAGFTFPRPALSSPVIVTGIHGRALLFAGAEMETVAKGRTVVATAACPSLRVNPETGGAALLLTWLADPATERDQALLARGLSRREIEGLMGVFGKEG